MIENYFCASDGSCITNTLRCYDMFVPMLTSIAKHAMTRGLNLPDACRTNLSVVGIVTYSGYHTDFRITPAQPK